MTTSIHALSPRIVAAHGLTGTGKSTVFPLAVAQWTYKISKINPGLILCAQPRRILAHELCNRVRENRKMLDTDKTVRYRIATEASRDGATKVLYCTEAVLALITQSHIQGAASTQKPENVTTVTINEVHKGQRRATLLQRSLW